MASNFYGVVFSDVRVFLIGLQVGFGGKVHLKCILAPLSTENDCPERIVLNLIMAVFSTRRLDPCSKIDPVQLLYSRDCFLILVPECPGRAEFFAVPCASKVSGRTPVTIDLIKAGTSDFKVKRTARDFRCVDMTGRRDKTDSRDRTDRTKTKGENRQNRRRQ